MAAALAEALGIQLADLSQLTSPKEKPKDGRAPSRKPSGAAEKKSAIHAYHAPKRSRPDKDPSSSVSAVRPKLKASTSAKAAAGKRKRSSPKRPTKLKAPRTIQVAVTKVTMRPKRGARKGDGRKAEEYRKAYNLKAAERLRVRSGQGPQTLLSDLSLGDLRKRWLAVITNLRASTIDDQPNPFELSRDQLEAEWARRAAEHPDYFDWPSTDARPGDGHLANTGWEETGMLGYLGYHVGKTSKLRRPQREVLLSYIFSMRLPRLNSAAYMRSWGDPETAPRLEKMAESLAAFVRLRKQHRDHVFVEAVGQWEDDLKFLYERFYVGKFRFVWPAL